MFPDRIKNLYFAFVFAAKALAKAGPIIEKMDLSTGNEAGDTEAREGLRTLLEMPHSVTGAFDESAMFRVTREEVVRTCPSVLGGMGDLEELQRR